MSGTQRPPQPVAASRQRGRFSLIWLAPIAAVAVGGYLTATTLAARGPEVTVTFATADGLMAGTKVLHKGVQLGTVGAVGLTDDLANVMVHARMTADAKPYLTEQAHFWVVRPQISGGDLSGLTTLLSGSYIEMDPGPPHGQATTAFKGLATPPAARSDQPGTTFILHAATVSSLTSGTPVFFRDVVAGQVLENHVAEGSAAVTAEVFVKAPFDKRVRTGSVFWQATGLSTTLTGTGLHVELSSIQAAVSGGVAFGTPPDAPDYPAARAETTFPLFASEPEAIRASYSERIPAIIYFNGAAPGLGVGSPVQVYDVQVGEVTGVRLQYDYATGLPLVRAAIDLLPQKLDAAGFGTGQDAAANIRQLVAGGMRAELETTSYVTNAQAVSLTIKPGLQPAQVTTEAGMMVLPVTQASGGGLLASIPGLAAKVDAIPFESLGRTANGAIAALVSTANAVLAGQPARAAEATFDRLRGTIAATSANLDPALKDLPGLADGLQQTLAHLNQTLASADLNYGTGSDRPDSIDRLAGKYFDLARYVRLLADYIARHPEAIVRGTTAQGSER